jgi:hypothetical protein
MADNDRYSSETLEAPRDCRPRDVGARAIPRRRAWRAIKGERTKQPYAIGIKDGSPFALGGIWESVHPETGEVIRNFCVITTDATELLARAICQPRRASTLRAPGHLRLTLESDHVRR